MKMGAFVGWAWPTKSGWWAMPILETQGGLSLVRLFHAVAAAAWRQSLLSGSGPMVTSTISLGA
jgi:hypothetical protein